MKLILLITLVFIPLQTSLACPCKDPPFLHTQNQFCDNDFVIKAKIQQRQNILNEIRYKIKIKEVYKSTGAVDAILSTSTKKFLWTPIGKYACEAEFKLKKTYVITGTVSPSSTLFTTSCHWNVLFGKLNGIEKENIKKNYPDNCGKCKVIHSWPVSRLGDFCEIWPQQAKCGRQTWCECQDDECKYCQFHPSDKFSECISGIVVPIGKK